MTLTNSPYKLKIQNPDGEFESLHALLENLYKKLHKEGIGTSTTKAGIITNEEDKLWESTVLNSETPDGLLNAVIMG